METDSRYRTRFIRIVSILILIKISSVNKKIIIFDGYKREILKLAMEKVVRKKYFIPPDDSEIVAKMTSHDVMIVLGDHSNIKVIHK